MRRRTLILLGTIAGALLVAGVSTATRAAGTLTGAGSSLVYPLVSQWIPAYQAKTGTRITYGSIGSGGGISAITSRTVDFGASDAPLTPDQFSAARGVIQIPWALSALAVGYNVKGVPDHLKLSGSVIADMYLGKIKRWNDARIAKLNHGVKLPSTDVAPLYRSDASGSTFGFTSYLASVSSSWKSRVGHGTLVNFPTGVGAKGSAGVAGLLNQRNGAIAYVEVAYLIKNHIPKAAVQNRAGSFRLPGLTSIEAAARTVRRVPSNNAISIVNPPSVEKLAYPISTFTYVIVPLKTSKAAELKQFISWAISAGQSRKFTYPLLFVPIPGPVQAAAKRALARVRS